MGMSVNFTERIKTMKSKKKKVILTALIIGAIAEIAAVAYMANTREVSAFGGEYLVLPLVMLCAYIVTEIIGETERNKEKPIRLTRRTKRGHAVLTHAAFPEYAEETLMNEVSCFEPMKTAVEKLCVYEEREYNVQK